MPSSWLTKLVLALAFSVLPLQALAETIQVLLCHSQSAAVEVAGDRQAHGQNAHDHGEGHADPSQTTDGWHANAYDDFASGHGDHFCCDAAATALPLFSKQLKQENFASILPAIEVRRDSIFLELLQRPPLV
jgi:hypothetical protein